MGERQLEFGTGGMRAKRGEGPGRINAHTISRAAQALAQEILENPEPGRLSVVVAYDSRIASHDLALTAAATLTSFGILCHIFKDIAPVAYLSFAVRHLGARAGVMITASHNPPEYSGIKIFWEDGAQVTPPRDESIARRYRANEKMVEGKKDPKLFSSLGQEIEDEYIRHISPHFPHRKLCSQRGGDISIVYTALHGTGLYPCTRLLKHLGFTRVSTVEEQDTPDGRFPTVTSPNPEEPSSLKLAVAQMVETKADICLGTDPDSDRVGLALEHKGKIHYPTGNQLALLMLHYILTRNPVPPKSYIISSIVTTPLLKTMASRFGVDTETTLTGFKWMGQRIGEIERENPDRHFLFAAEESFGLLHHPHIRDKDGPASLGLLCELALYHKTCGRTLVDALDLIYQEFGFHHESLLTLSFDKPEEIENLMDFFRSHEGETLAGQKILSRRDYLQEGELPPSNMLAFSFEGEETVFVRPSGTELKIKFYLMLNGRKAKERTKEWEEALRDTSTQNR